MISRGAPRMQNRTPTFERPILTSGKFAGGYVSLIYSTMLGIRRREVPGAPPSHAPFLRERRLLWLHISAMLDRNQSELPLGQW
jgi:hypothetical protein